MACSKGEREDVKKATDRGKAGRDKRKLGVRHVCLKKGAADRYVREAAGIQVAGIWRGTDG